MTSVKIELTDTQLKSLEYVAVSPQEWADNLLTNRARIAIDEIIKIAMNWYMDNGVQIPTTRDEIIYDAFERGIIKTAAERKAEAEAQDNF